MKKKLLIIGVGILVALFVIVVASIYAFGPHFPYINWAPWDLAHYLAKNDRPASECLDLIFFEVLAPTQAEQRALCVYEYAKIAKDPSACELLMPSKYGLSCVGAAREINEPCYLKPDLSVGGNGITATLEDCANGPKNITDNACCIISKVSSIVGYDDCSSLNDQPAMNDQCLNELAFKKKDPSFCIQIQNNNTRSACNVQTKALQQDPSICEGCTQPIDDIKDLK